MVRTFVDKLQAEQAPAPSAVAATGSAEVVICQKLVELGRRKRAEACSKAREKASPAMSTKLERKKIKVG
jgi:hypothetical protein